MWFWWHDYFSRKNHIVAVWVNVDYLSAEFPDRGLYLRPQDYVSLGIPAKIYDWIFWRWAEKLLMVGTFSDSWNQKNRWQERIPNQKNVFRIGRNTFHDQKKKILMKIREFKRSGIGLIAEFRGIPNGFPNLAWKKQIFTLSISQVMHSILLPTTWEGLSGQCVGCISHVSQTNMTGQREGTRSKWCSTKTADRIFLLHPSTKITHGTTGLFSCQPVSNCNPPMGKWRGWCICVLCITNCIEILSQIWHLSSCVEVKFVRGMQMTPAWYKRSSMPTWYECPSMHLPLLWVLTSKLPSPVTILINGQLSPLGAGFCI
jgi:hypothetical protein